jgi:hypothetical protein
MSLRLGTADALALRRYGSKATASAVNTSDTAISKLKCSTLFAHRLKFSIGLLSPLIIGPPMRPVNWEFYVIGSVKLKVSSMGGMAIFRELPGTRVTGL